MPKSTKRTQADLRARLKKQRAKAAVTRKSLPTRVAPHKGKREAKSKIATQKVKTKKKPVATPPQLGKPSGGRGRGPGRTGSGRGRGRGSGRGGPSAVFATKRPASHLDTHPPRKGAQTLAKRPAAATPEEIIEPVPFPKSDNPFCWLRREDKIRSEHEAIMQGLRREKKEMEEKYQKQTQSQRDAMFASLAQNQLETRRVVDDLRMKQAIEIERRAHAEGRAHAMAKLWRRGGYSSSRSLVSDNHSQRRSGRIALSDTNSVQGEDGEATPVGANEEDIATAALAAAASRVVEVPLVASSDVPGAESGSACDTSGRPGAASLTRAGSLKGSGTRMGALADDAPAASAGRSGSRTSPQEAGERASSPPGDGPVPSSARRRCRSSLSNADLGRALAPPPPPGLIETTIGSDPNSDRRSAARVGSGAGSRRPPKGSGKTAQPSERTLPRARANAPLPVTLGQQAALIGEEL